MIEEEIDVDQLLEDLKMNCGGFYPTGAYFLLLYNIMIVMMDVFTMSFTAWIPEELLPNLKNSRDPGHKEMFPHICNDTVRDSIHPSNWSKLHPDSIVDNTDLSIVAKFNIVCQGDELMINLTNTIFLVGIIIASFISMPIADKIGRKPVLFASLWIMGVAHVIVIWATDHWQYIFGFRLICGIFHAGAAFCNLVMFGELFGPTHRFLTYLFSGLTLPFGLSMLALIGYLVREWQDMHVVFACLYGVTLITFWFVPESVKWLSTRKGKKNRKRIIDVLGKELNGRLNRYLITSDPQLKSEWHSLLQEEMKGRYIEESENGGGIDNFAMVGLNSVKPGVNGFSNGIVDGQNNRVGHGVANVAEKETTRDREKTWTWTLIKYLIIMCYCWGVVGWTFFGLIMSSNETEGDRFLNFFLTVIVDLPGFIIAAVIGVWGSRRWSLSFLYMTCGLPFLFAAIIRAGMDNQGVIDKNCKYDSVAINNTFNSTISPSNSPCGEKEIRHDVLKGLHIVGHFGAGGSLLVIELITNEIFPTVARSTCFGICAAISRITAVAATFAATLKREEPIAYEVILIILNLGAAYLLWWLPETRGAALPQTSADLDVFQKKFEDRGGCMANLCIGCLDKRDTDGINRDGTAVVAVTGRDSKGGENRGFEA